MDFVGKTKSIKHKVLQDEDGVVGYDVMKTKSSYRTLPLIPVVEQALIAVYRDYSNSTRNEKIKASEQSSSEADDIFFKSFLLEF